MGRLHVVRVVEAALAAGAAGAAAPAAAQVAAAAGRVAAGAAAAGAGVLAVPLRWGDRDRDDSGPGRRAHGRQHMAGPARPGLSHTQPRGTALRVPGLWRKENKQQANENKTKPSGSSPFFLLFPLFLIFFCPGGAFITCWKGFTSHPAQAVTWSLERQTQGWLAFRNHRVQASDREFQPSQTPVEALRVSGAPPPHMRLTSTFGDPTWIQSLICQEVGGSFEPEGLWQPPGARVLCAGDQDSRGPGGHLLGLWGPRALGSGFLAGPADQTG